MTWSPTSRLCGSSVVTEDTPAVWVQVEINLLFLLKSKLFSPIPVKVDSAVDVNPVVLDSWIIKPDSGVFAFASSLGMTTLSL